MEEEEQARWFAEDCLKAVYGDEAKIIKLQRVEDVYRLNSVQGHQFVYDAVSNEGQPLDLAVQRSQTGSFQCFETIRSAGVLRELHRTN